MGFILKEWLNMDYSLYIEFIFIEFHFKLDLKQSQKIPSNM